MQSLHIILIISILMRSYSLSTLPSPSSSFTSFWLIHWASIHFILLIIVSVHSWLQILFPFAAIPNITISACTSSLSCSLSAYNIFVLQFCPEEKNFFSHHYLIFPLILLWSLAHLPLFHFGCSTFIISINFISICCPA